MSWELIHFRLLHPSESFMKAMGHHQTLNGLPKPRPKKLNRAPCTIRYTAKMTTFPKITTVDNSNIQLGELIHIYFALYNVTSICEFTSMLTVISTKTIMIWSLSTEYKQSHVRIIHFILTTLNNEQHLWKRVIFDEYGALEISTDFTNLLVDELNISMETTGGNASWINGKKKNTTKAFTAW